MHIELHIPRPGLTLLAVAAVSGWALYFTSGTTQSATIIEAPAMESPAAPVNTPSPLLGSLTESPAMDSDEGSHLSQTEMRIKWSRAQQELLRVKQDIIRDQLAGLQKERNALGDVIDPELEQQFRQSVQLLTSLVKDENRAEEFTLMNFRQQWQAEERAMAAATGTPQGAVALYWPVEPTIGISAYFLDKGYKERFKVEHYAIDIPTAQGTDILVAADGIVKDVVDHGLGYNYITVDHGGYATDYGHVSAFSVRPGQHVRAGDRLGKSGGMPGLPGGGSSTGPHVHFGVYIKGKPVDPLKYLPKYRG